MKISRLILLVALASWAFAMQAADLEPIRQSCTIGEGDKAGTLRLGTDNGECGSNGHRHCGTNMSDVSMSRITGVSLADLAQSGSHLTATLTAEAGTFTCAGTVKDLELRGDAVFTPDAAFVTRMEKMGFNGFESDKLMAYAFLNVESGWARSLKDLGIRGINVDNLIALRVFNVDPAYVHSITALGYDLPSADELISLRVQGVNGEEVREIRALGYKPTLDQLVQIRIFKITPDFIQRMQARGFKNLTIDKLVQIRIFKLAD
jgi:hypothetical protein